MFLTQIQKFSAVMYLIAAASLAVGFYTASKVGFQSGCLMPIAVGIASCMIIFFILFVLVVWSGWFRQ